MKTYWFGIVYAIIFCYLGYNMVGWFGVFFGIVGFFIPFLFSDTFMNWIIKKFERNVKK